MPVRKEQKPINYEILLKESWWVEAKQGTHLEMRPSIGIDGVKNALKGYDILPPEVDKELIPEIAVKISRAWKKIRRLLIEGGGITTDGDIFTIDDEELKERSRKVMKKGDYVQMRISKLKTYCHINIPETINGSKSTFILPRKLNQRLSPIKLSGGGMNFMFILDPNNPHNRLTVKPLLLPLANVVKNEYGELPNLVAQTPLVKVLLYELSLNSELEEKDLELPVF